MKIRIKIDTTLYVNVFLGCASNCDLKTCDDLDSDEECFPDEKFSGCVCNDGFVLQNGACVAEARCRKF